MTRAGDREKADRSVNDTSFTTQDQDYATAVLVKT